MPNSSRLLIDESPLFVLPSLARSIGLNEAIILQQMHYWLSGPAAHQQDGKVWIYNSYSSWVQQFPFWTQKQVRTAINNLEESGLLIAGNYNKSRADRTKWYSIDYDALDMLAAQLPDTSQSMDQRACHMSPGATENESEGMPSALEGMPSDTDGTVSALEGKSTSALEGKPVPERDYTETTTGDARNNNKTPNQYLGGDSFIAQFFQTWENEIGTFGPHLAAELNDFEDQHHPPASWGREAVLEAVESGVRNWRYIRAILTTWVQQGKGVSGPGSANTTTASSPDYGVEVEPGFWQQGDGLVRYDNPESPVYHLYFNKAGIPNGN